MAGRGMLIKKAIILRFEDGTADQRLKQGRYQVVQKSVFDKGRSSA